MSREDLIQAIMEKMRTSLHAMHVGQSFPLGEVALNMPQVHILASISHRKEGVSVKELAEMLKVTPGAVSQLVDSLVKKDLVTREEDPKDRRSVRIRLTTAVDSKFDKFRQDYFALIYPAFNALRDAEIEQLLKLLT